jgi:hypothetical protein
LVRGYNQLEGLSVEKMVPVASLENFFMFENTCTVRWLGDYNSSETCEKMTPFKSVPSSEVFTFQGAICTENSSLGSDEVSLFYRMSSFRKVAIHRFHCTCD